MSAWHRFIQDSSRTFRQGMQLTVQLNDAVSTMSGWHRFIQERNASIITGPGSYLLYKPVPDRTRLNTLLQSNMASEESSFYFPTKGYRITFEPMDDCCDSEMQMSEVSKTKQTSVTALYEIQVLGKTLLHYKR